MDRRLELGTARGFARMNVRRAERELERAKAEYDDRDLEYRTYLNAPKCWCGGLVGRRTHGDIEGVGCLENIYH